MTKPWIIKQVKSSHGRMRRQRASLVGLGLGRIGKVSTRQDSAAIRGMIAKVRHLIAIEQQGGES